jgi:starch phosphorylase
VKGNDPKDAEITHFLYGGDERYRLKQEMVLGIGGVMMLETLGFKIRKYHMNEGHSSLLAYELCRRYENDLKRVRELCVFTTHTPVEAAHDKFQYNLVESVMGKNVDLDLLKKFGGQDELNMTLFALNMSEYVNGVAKVHRDVSKELFPGYEIHAITNGIHSYTWTCNSFRKIYDKYLPGWTNDPGLLVRADLIPDAELWNAHIVAKQSLIDYVNELENVGMDYESLTLGFARRATAYKRLNLLFSDLEKLENISNKGKIQIIYAGKAHPKDEPGKQLIKDIFNHIKKLEDKIKIVYIENYDLVKAMNVISGVDVWLNTPLPPFEASGTSGMKAAHNGVINFSVLDGWWTEGWIEGVTGWAIGPPQNELISYEKRNRFELDDLYNKFEYVILPLFYEQRDNWIKMMKNSIEKIAYYFNSHRMINRYVIEAYL